MSHPFAESHPLMRLFRGLTEATFLSELGIAEPPLIDYVAELLARFVPAESVWRIRDGQGRRLVQLTAMLAEAESASDAQRRRDCHQHVGDFALFWTGVFPEAIARISAGTADGLVDFQQQGKRSYLLASTLADNGEVLRSLSDQFELCAFGLSRVRKEWERMTPEPGAGPRPILAL